MPAPNSWCRRTLCWPRAVLERFAYRKAVHPTVWAARPPGLPKLIRQTRRSAATPDKLQVRHKAVCNAGENRSSGATVTPNLIYYTPALHPGPRRHGTTDRRVRRAGEQPDGAFYTLEGEPYNPASEDFGGGYTLTTKDGMVIRIDGQSGLMSSATDRNGNQLTFSDGGVNSSSGIQVTIGRDVQGRIAMITDPLGKSVTYSYDADGNLATVTDREGNVTRFAYRTGTPRTVSSVPAPVLVPPTFSTATMPMAIAFPSVAAARRRAT